MNRIVAYACLALSMSLVGGYVALSRPLVLTFPVFLLAWLRFGIGGIAMARWLKKPANELPMTPQIKRLVFLESFLGNFLFSIFMLFGISMTTAVSAGVILASIPAAVAVLSWVFLRERITLRVAGAIACAVIGIGLVSLFRGESSAHTGAAAAGGSALALSPNPVWLGNLLLVCAVLCESFYAVIGKKLTGALSPKRISSLINLWGFVLVTPLGLWAAWHFNFSNVSPAHWALLLFYSLAASVWAVWLWMTGLKIVPASQAGVFGVMLPISAAAVGVLVLGERLTGTHLGAFAIALIGVILATLPQGTPQTTHRAASQH